MPLRSSSVGQSLANRQSSSGDAAVVEPEADHRATVIFLHGLGDTGDGWAAVTPQLKRLLPPTHAGHVRWLLPHALQRPVTLNKGMAMPSWFDLVALSPDAKEDEEGLSHAASRISSYVDREVRGATRRTPSIKNASINNPVFNGPYPLTPARPQL